MRQRFGVHMNMTYNEGSHDGLFVVQQDANFGVEKAIEEGIDALNKPGTSPDLKLIPVITEEFGAPDYYDALIKYWPFIGSIASFGTGSTQQGSTIKTHFGVILHDTKEESPDFLLPILRTPVTILNSELFKNGKKSALRQNLSPLHLALGTMTVKGNHCRLKPKTKQ